METKKLLGICALIVILAIIIGLIILSIAILSKQQPQKEMIVNNSRIIINGHPINSTEAERIGTINRSELIKQYPSN